MSVVTRARILFVALLAVAASLAALPAAADGKHWVCPPCGAPCDSLGFDGPGTCPKCGMALVEEGSAAAAPKSASAKVAILVFDGVEILDYTGPYEMFGAANCDVYTVGETTKPVTTAMGMTVVPKYSFADAPQPDVLVVPGGSVRAAGDSVPTLAWIRNVAAGAKHTLSVCNGAFILAHAGLLDGLTATTTNGNLARLANEFPKIHVVRDRRFVDNGRIVTAAGLSAGIDGALHVIGTLFGEGTAQAVALVEEYDYRPGGGFVRAALADQEIPDLGLASLGAWDVAKTEGTTARWSLSVRGSSALSESELAERLGTALETKGRWKKVDGGAGAAGGGARAFTFTGRSGAPWRGTLEVRSVPGEAHHYVASVTVAAAAS